MCEAAARLGGLDGRDVGRGEAAGPQARQQLLQLGVVAHAHAPQHVARPPLCEAAEHSPRHSRGTRDELTPGTCHAGSWWVERSAPVPQLGDVQLRAGHRGVDHVEQRAGVAGQRCRQHRLALRSGHSRLRSSGLFCISRMLETGHAHST